MWRGSRRNEGAQADPLPGAGIARVAVSVRTTHAYASFLYRYDVSSCMRNGAFFSSSIMSRTEGAST